MAQTSSTAGYGIEDVYKSVINDVISSIKDIFLDESIDVEVLSQLKTEWENKVNASGVLGFDTTRGVSALRHPQIKQSMPPTFIPQAAPGPSNFTQHHPRVNPGFVSVPSSSGFLRPPIPQTQQAQQPRQINVPHQPNSVIKSDHGLKQLDGGGPGMTDSSSEEEDEEEDQLGRFVNLEDERVEDAEGVEEDPLNSNDDQSDDEDLETLFQADNVIVCQFEKVNRARTKWKFTLKDGIMHLNGKDYCFQKAVGEAEW